VDRECWALETRHCPMECSRYQSVGVKAWNDSRIQSRRLMIALTYGRKPPHGAGEVLGTVSFLDVGGGCSFLLLCWDSSFNFCRLPHLIFKIGTLHHQCTYIFIGYGTKYGDCKAPSLQYRIPSLAPIEAREESGSPTTSAR
jgi:hypothetical protein